MSQSPLHNVHEAAGATMRLWQGVERPWSFGNTDKELAGARSAPTVIDFSGFGLLRFSGPDTVDYLHRMLSNAVKTLAQGQWNHTCVLRGDGRMLGDGWLFRNGEQDFSLLTVPAARSLVREQLEKFIIMEQVTVEDRSDSTMVVLLLNPANPEPRGQVITRDAPVSTHSFVPGFLSVPAKLIICDAVDAPKIWQRFMDNGVPTAGISTFETLRIERGFPLFGQDMDETTIPLEAGLYDAVDFTKGCFPGQEIVARINNLGHPANRLVRWKTNKVAEAVLGANIQIGDKAIGRVTSVSPASTEGSSGLGYVKWNHRESGTAIEIHSPSGVHPAVIAGEAWYAADGSALQNR